MNNAYYLQHFNRSADQSFANNYFLNIEYGVKNEIFNKPKVPNVRNEFINAFDICENIKKKEKYLRDNLSNISNDTFKIHIDAIELLKNQLENQISHLGKSSNVLKHKLKRRSSKRLRLKRLREEQKVRKNEQQKVNEQKDKDFKEKLAIIKAEIEEKERVENVNLEANSKLRDVHKCKSDAKRNISLLEALYKLRIAREKSAVGRGEIVSVSDSKSFLSSIEKIIHLWKNALSKYETEEKMFKSILKSENKVNIDNSSKVDVTQSIEKKWKCVMFGDENLLPQRNFNGSFEKFINVRKQWDQYLCFDGSKIPSNWLTPPTLSDEWKNHVNIV